MRNLPGTPHFYIGRTPPQVGSLLVAVKAGNAAMIAMDEAAF
jgi:hypothetical protein